MITWLGSREVPRGLGVDRKPSVAGSYISRELTKYLYTLVSNFRK